MTGGGRKRTTPSKELKAVKKPHRYQWRVHLGDCQTIMLIGPRRKTGILLLRHRDVRTLPGVVRSGEITVTLRGGEARAIGSPETSLILRDRFIPRGRSGRHSIPS